ncbi:hypothetical protein BMF94_3358 [Rhodotorula taiwanensis]|uniref:Uncharacterized protein n=1 Tax=Rhodotorula taiwanensis TaxID=741276 RepID=A0A2S5BAM4_9BASI|nr:hypothetical protein BMF94_3358 [Rhodotorula taiwanensis]
MRCTVVCPPLTITVNDVPYGPGRAIRTEQKRKPAVEALLRLCSSATELELLLSYGHGVSVLLNSVDGQSLRHLRLCGDFPGGDWLQALRRYPALASLSLSFNCDACTAFTGTLDKDAAPAPPIRHLEVEVDLSADEVLRPSIFRLIEHFAETLVTLELCWTSVDLVDPDETSSSAGSQISAASQASDETEALDDRFEADFPRLHQLALEGEESRAPHLLQSITSVRYPSLQTLDARVFGADPSAADLPDINRVNIATQPSALTRAIASLTFPPSEPAITVTPATHSLPTTETQARTTSHGSPAIPSDSFDVQRTLDFIGQRAASAYAVNADAALADIAKQLETFEQQRVLLEAWTDPRAIAYERERRSRQTCLSLNSVPY